MVSSRARNIATCRGRITDRRRLGPSSSFSLTPNAAVTLTASGLVTGTVTAKTNTKGQITVNTPKISSSATGSETYTVTNVVLSGYLYDASKNKVTSATLTR